MSRHVRGSGPGAAWLVADQSNGDYRCYWYTSKSGDHVEEEAGATTATLAVAWARVRTSQGTIRMADHRTYWAGTAATPAGIAFPWVEDGRKTAKQVLREERS